MKFRTTESDIAAKVGHPVSPIRLFDVDGLGLSFAALQTAALPSFATMPWDEYDVRLAQVELVATWHPECAGELMSFLPGFFAGDRSLAELERIAGPLSADAHARLAGIRPFRRRAAATIVAVRTTAGRWTIERGPDAAFTQAGDHDGDVRRLERRFAPIDPAVTDAPAYRELLQRLADVVHELRDGATSRLRIVCHHMGLEATPDGATNAPEGIHQDGADYIVSALVLDRRNVTGGESTVYGPDKRAVYLRHTLLDGEGLFQADAGTELWHSVTPIRPADAGQSAHRHIIGFDVSIEA